MEAWSCLLSSLKFFKHSDLSTPGILASFSSSKGLCCCFASGSLHMPGPFLLLTFLSSMPHYMLNEGPLSLSQVFLFGDYLASEFFLHNTYCVCVYVYSINKCSLSWILTMTQSLWPGTLKSKRHYRATLMNAVVDWVHGQLNKWLSCSHTLHNVTLQLFPWRIRVDFPISWIWTGLEIGLASRVVEKELVCQFQA